MEYFTYCVIFGLFVGLMYLLNELDKREQVKQQKLDFDTLTDCWADLADLKRLNGESSEDLRKRITDKLGE